MSKITVSHFLSAFFPDGGEQIHLRAFGPKKAPTNDPRFTARKLSVTRQDLETDVNLQRALQQHNATRGVYFVVNAGGETDAEITRYNAWFAEDDGRSIEEQYKALDEAPLPTSIRVVTHKSVHAYWLIAGECGEAEWRDVQQRLIAYFGGDEKIKNPSRVMRLPFFKHVSYDKEGGELTYKRVELTEFVVERRYTLEEMKAAFPPQSGAGPTPAAPAIAISQSTSEFSTWEELNAEAARRIRNSPKAKTDSRGWTHAPGLCHASTEGTAIYLSPEGAYGCHKGCSPAQVRAAYGLPEKPAASESDASVDKVQSTTNRPSKFNLSTLKDLLDEPEEEVAYVWDLTLPRGGFSICAAKPKVGKSTLVRNLAVAVSRGEDFFGRATMKGKVIYLCLEEKRAEIASHFRRMGLTEEDIIIHTGSTPSSALAALEDVIAEYSPALVIIDPLSRFGSIREFNDYGDVTRGLAPLIDLARGSECQCHILAVHHNSKGDREAGDALLGSTALFGTVDTLLTMRKRDNTRTLETNQRYGKNIEETVVNLDLESGLVTQGCDMHALQFEKRKSEVLDSIGDETLSENDIKQRVRGNLGLASKAVRALFNEGRLLRTGTGKKGDPYLYEKRTEQTQ